MYLFILIIYYTRNLGDFFINFFEFIHKYSIFNFFASISENPEEIDKYQASQLSTKSTDEQVDSNDDQINNITEKQVDSNDYQMSLDPLPQNIKRGR